MIEITYILLAVIVLVVLIDLYLKKKKESAATKDIQKEDYKNKEHDLKQRIYHFVFQKKLIKALFFIYAIITVLFLLFHLRLINDTTLLTNWQEFNQEMLQNGKVNKVVVVNKEKAYIYIEKEFLSEKQFKIAGKKAFGNALNLGPHFYFEIGSVETFSNDLKDAQIAFDNEDKISPLYETKNDVFDLDNDGLLHLIILYFFIFISFLCIQVVRYHIKRKNYLMACFCISLSSIIMSSPYTYIMFENGVFDEYINKFDAEYIDWENKEFTINRWTPSCSNPELSKFKYTIELKYEDEKVLYKLAIVSTSPGLYDINKLECGPNPNNGYGTLFSLEDVDGYELHELSIKSFKHKSGRLPLGYQQEGKYYINKGEFYMSRNSFKKIKGFEKE